MYNPVAEATIICPLSSLTIRPYVAGRSEPTRTERIFSLPPVMEHFYKSGHPEYRPLPPIKQWEADEAESPMRFIYPADGSIVKRPRQTDGSPEAIVCKVAHSDPLTELFWHLDTRYLGSTWDLHQCAIRPSRGCHTVTVVDAVGCSLSINLIVV